MALKKIRYNTGKKIFRLKIDEDNGMNIDKWVVMEDDFIKLVNLLSDKYGLIKRKFKDLNWAK